MNRVLVVGPLARDPVLRFLRDGTAEAELDVLLDPDGVDTTAHVVVRLRGAHAPRIALELNLDDLALVEGRLQGVEGHSGEIAAHRVSSWKHGAHAAAGP